MLCCGKPKASFSCEVILLDGSRLTFSKNQNVKITTKGFVLFQAVCQHLNLVEKDYFGLKFYGNHSSVYWLDPVKALRSDECFMQVFANEPCTLYFGVKFYAADPSKIKEEVTRYQFFLQLKQDLLTSKLTCSWKKAAELSALAIQSEIGDYHPSEHKSGYVSEFRFVKNQDDKFETEVARLHAMFKGLVPASAEAQYLRKCHQLDTYGVEMHPVKGDAGMQFMLGISPRGIETFRNKYRIAVYYWPRIERVDYKDQYLKIQVKTKQDKDTTHNFELQSSEHCQVVWKSVIEHHVFYRLPQNAAHATWNKKFRYSGRTEAELLQSEVEREEPEVHRGSSKRYPPRSASNEEDEVPKDNSESVKTKKSGKKVDDEQNKSWNDVLQKKGMFSVSETEQNSAVKYITPKSERRERNRQLQSLSDNENRNRKHRSHRGRSSGEESDSPSKRRIRSRARHNRGNNYQSDASDASHRRRRRAYYTDTEMGNRVRADLEKSKRRQHTNSISSPQSETRSQRKQKRLSREDEQARQQLWQHIRREHVDPIDDNDQLNDIPYTEIKTHGNPYPNKRHSRHHANRRSTTSTSLGGQAMEDGMVSPLQVTTTVQREQERTMYGNGNHHHKYNSPSSKPPGKDWDTRTPSSAPSSAGKHQNRSHNTKASESRRHKDSGLKLVYSQI